MSATRTLVDAEGAPWTDVTESMRRGSYRVESWETKVLTAPDGLRVLFHRITGVGGPHIHTKASAGYIFEGEMDLRGNVCRPGTWYLEPYGAIHPQTTFRKVLFGFGMREGIYGNNGNIRLDDVDNLPPWVGDIGAKVDELKDAVVADALPWQPYSDGLATKVLYVFERSSWFASMLKAQPGATLPRRRYVGPLDMYVLSGRVQFTDGTIAERGWWIHEPAGAVEDVVTFPVETVLLVNTYGTVLEYDAVGAVTRIIDGWSLQREPAAAS
jgi:hypothetical protein